jgi:hypothetical protein
MNESISLRAHLVHASPGRLRLRLDPIDLSNPRLRESEKRLTQQPGVRTVQANSLVGSVVVTYDEGEVRLEHILSTFEQSGVTVSTDLTQNGGASPVRPLDQTISSFFGSHDERVRRRTGGFLDLRTMIPAGLAVLAAREILAGRAVAAPWYALAWYAYSSYMHHRRPSESQNGRTTG